MKPDTIVFDLGNVLVDWNPRYLYRKLSSDEAEIENFLATICTHQWNEKQDAGRSIADAEAELISKHPDMADWIRAFYGRFDETMAGPIHGTADLLTRLHAKGVRLFALSNWSAETLPFARRRFEFLNLFRHIVVSGEVKQIKPEAAIYHTLLAVAERPADACFFIDDNAANIAAAQKLGFHTHHFKQSDLLARDLARLGFLE